MKYPYGMLLQLFARMLWPFALKALTNLSGALFMKRKGKICCQTFGRCHCSVVARRVIIHETTMELVVNQEQMTEGFALVVNYVWENNY